MTARLSAPNITPDLRLIIIHYHLRPGGIRRVIELAAPFLARRLGLAEVVLGCGEPAAEQWHTQLRQKLAPVPVRCVIEPAFRYLSEQTEPPAEMERRMESSLNRLFEGATAGNCVVWAHNLGIGRNLLLSRAVARACAKRKLRLLLHHHDWWFENRWRRRPEMQASGFGTLQSIGRTIFPGPPQTRHIAINRSDARGLQRHFGRRALWLPNLTQPFPEVPAARLRAARSWLHQSIVPREAPVWIVPARVLRRKNLAEALLLARWLRPEAWLISTAGASSADEAAYAAALEGAARKHRWPMRLGVLRQAGPEAPNVAELLAASEVVLLTSIQEGFGLPYVEAAAAGRPLIARAIPSVAPDLRQFGFKLPYLYDEVMIHPELFDWEAERRRQEELFGVWRAQLPRACRAWAGAPWLSSTGSQPRPAPFSRLTLTAQLEVLAQPAERSWTLCAPLNLQLPEWRRRAQAGKLQSSPWPKTAERWLGGEAYARRFQGLLQDIPAPAPDPNRGSKAQTEFIRRKLRSEHLFPLLWALQT